MRRRTPLALASLLAVLALAGCLEVGSKTEVKRDGSGTYTQTTTVEMDKARAYAKQLAAQARGLGLPPEDAEDPFTGLDTKKRLADLKTREGIRVTSSDESEDKAKKTRTYVLGVAFDSLEALFTAGVIEDVSVKLEHLREAEAKESKAKGEAKEGKANARMVWKLTIRHVFDGRDREPLEGKDADRLAAMRRAMLKRYETLWGTLSISSTLVLPTPVLETNGTRKKGTNAVTWHIGFLDLADARKLVQEVTFEDAEGLKLKAFDISADDIANAAEEAELEAARRKAEAEKKAAAKKKRADK